MCGHLDQRLPYDLALLAEVIDEIASFPGWDPIVIPMHPLMVMTATGVVAGRWGIQDNKTLHVHARRESLSGFWRTEKAEHRCAVPCLGWWEGSWHFSRPDVLWLAGIWRDQPFRGPGGIASQRPGIAVITAPAASRWHLTSDRHPIPLTFEQARVWCAPAAPDTALDDPIADLHCDGVTTRGSAQQTLF